MWILSRILYGILFCFMMVSPAGAESFSDYVERLNAHPQIESLLAESLAVDRLAEAATGLPDPEIALGVDNLPVSDPAFDRFLPSSKVIGFNQKIPNPAGLRARADGLYETAAQKRLAADYARARLKALFVGKLAAYRNVSTKQALVKEQLSYYTELEETLEGRIEAGRAFFHLFSDIDVKRADAERRLNDLNASRQGLEADLIRLVGAVPGFDVPPQAVSFFSGDPDDLYPVRIAAAEIGIAQQGVRSARADFLPSFGLSAFYKSREEGMNGMFPGDDWFSVQARVSIPLWAKGKQVPRKAAAKSREKKARFSYEDARRQWEAHIKTLQAQREAAEKNIGVLEDKSLAMEKKVEAMARNYEAGTERLDTLLSAKIAYSNIRAQLGDVREMHVTKTAEINALLASQDKDSE